jgi:hypothetical protein
LVDEGVTEHVCIADNPSARLWLVELTATLSHEEFARVAVTLWAIWYARRKIIHDGEFQSPLSTHLFIENYMWDLALTKPTAKPSGGVRHVHPSLD